MSILRRLPVAVVALAASVAVAPSAASAYTADYEGPEGAEILVVRAAPGEANSLGIQDGNVPESVTLYSGVRPFTSFSEYCYDNSYSSTGILICPAPNGVRVELGDGNDDLTVSSGVEEPVTVFGGTGDDQIKGWGEKDVLHGEAGNDRLSGYQGDDELFGGDGNDVLDAYSGADKLHGGSGDDLLHPDGYEDPSADVVDGGPGVDRIESDYSTRTLGDPEPNLFFSLGGGADDGRPGEHDDIRGVENLTLSKAAKVVGTDAAEYVKLHQVGDDGDLAGLGGDDELRGGDGADKIDGGAGADKLDGGFGDDTITGGPGRDRISADLAGGDCGPLWCKIPHGNDVVEARDGEADSVSCGVGDDRVVADAADTVAADCETIERPAVAKDTSGDKGGKGSGSGGSGSGGSGAGGSTGGGAADGTIATLVVAQGQRLRAALRRGLKVRVEGGAPGAKTQVRALLGKRVVATGTGAAGSTVTLRFTKAAKRSLARKATVRLRLVAGGAAAKVTLRR